MKLVKYHIINGPAIKKIGDIFRQISGFNVVRPLGITIFPATLNIINGHSKPAGYLPENGPLKIKRSGISKSEMMEAPRWNHLPKMAEMQRVRYFDYLYNRSPLWLNLEFSLFKSKVLDTFKKIFKHTRISSSDYPNQPPMKSWTTQK